MVSPWQMSSVTCSGWNRSLRVDRPPDPAAGGSPGRRRPVLRARRPRWEVTMSDARAARPLRIGDGAPDTGLEDGDVREKGRGATGEVIAADRRLFMQLLAFGGAPETAVLAAALDEAGLSAVLYEDVNDPTGVALLTFGENPESIVTELRPF